MLIILTTHPIQYQVPLWRALAKDGATPFEVWFLTDHGVRESRDREFDQSFAWDIDTLDGYPYRFLPRAEGRSPSFYSCRLDRGFRKRLTEAGATALWIQGWQVLAYWQAVKAAHAAKIPVWLRAESNDLAPVVSWKKPLKRLQLGWLFPRIDRFLAIGEANRRLYRRYGVPEEKLTRAPYAVDNDRFASQAHDLRNRRLELRRQWAIPDGSFCILFCGKFIPKKRPLDLVEAASRLIAQEGEISEASRSVHLLFVGSGSLGPDLRAVTDVCHDTNSPASDPSGVSEHSSIETPRCRPPASFAGFLNQTEISVAYVAADVLVLPSDHRETWGLVANEALVSGLPCLLSDACGSAEDLGKFDCAESFPLGDIGTLSEKLDRLRQRAWLPKDFERFAGEFCFGTTVRSVTEMEFTSHE